MTRRWFRNQRYNHATEEFPCPPPPMVAASELAQPPEGLFPWVDQPTSRGFLNREPTGYVKGCDVFAPPPPGTPFPTAPQAMVGPPPVYEMKGAQPMDEKDLACFVECFDLARAAVDERNWNAAAAWSGAASGWAQEFLRLGYRAFGGHMSPDHAPETSEEFAVVDDLGRFPGLNSIFASRDEAVAAFLLATVAASWCVSWVPGCE